MPPNVEAGSEMNMIIQIPRKGLQTLIVAGIAASMIPASAIADHQVISLSNQTSGNSLQIFSVNKDGSLTAKGTVPTGGIGTGGGLGSQGAVAFDSESELIAAVNAGDNTVSLLSAHHNDVKFITRFSSMGFRPVSVTLRNNLVFVLNQGDATHASGIQGFRLEDHQATPIAGSASALTNTFVNPAQISFSPNGRNLVVTEKGTNKIDIFNVNRQGILEGSNSFNSAGQTPFGFAFSNNGYLFVTEAFGGAGGASAVSSYGRANDDNLTVISPSVATTQTAACWAATSPDNHFVFAANTGSGTVSTFDISHHGQITLVGNSTPIVGAVPVDVTVNPNGRSLYLLGAGLHGIITFHIDWDGRLTRFDTDTELPGSVGLVVTN